MDNLASNTMMIVFALHAASTFFMVGVIWLVQMINYPLQSKIGKSSFREYYESHVKLALLVLGLPILIEVLTGILLVLNPHPRIPEHLPLMGLMFLLIIWCTTLFLVIPRHSKLLHGFDDAIHRSLLLANWIRTLFWTARGYLVVITIFLVMQPNQIVSTQFVPVMQKQQAQEVKHQDIQKFFNDFNKDRMDLVDQFYAEDIHFRDPLVNIKTREKIKEYYADMYKNVTDIKFEFSDEIMQGDTHTVVWKMKVKAKGLNGGKEVVTDGMSYIRFDENGQAIYHRDYFDVGEMVYEYVPIVGGMVRYIKRKMSSKHNK